MNHPHRLHATAAVWSLRSAWPHLAHAVNVERRQLVDDDAGTLRAWAPSTGGGGGVHHSDGLLLAILATGTLTVGDRYQRLADSTRETMAWLAGRILDDRYRPGDPVLTRLLEEIPRIPPAAAAEVARWVDEADSAVRSAVGLGLDHEPLVGVACPACGSRRLAVRTSAPSDRPVVCAAGGCACRGEGCPCGMDVRVEGVGHIWASGKMSGMRTHQVHWQVGVADGVCGAPRDDDRVYRCVRPIHINYQHRAANGETWTSEIGVVRDTKNPSTSCHLCGWYNPSDDHSTLSSHRLDDCEAVRR